MLSSISLSALSQQVLTLVSNERVPLSDAMRMVFEINSLKNATPATVSRAGILFINETGEKTTRTILVFGAEYLSIASLDREK